MFQSQEDSKGEDSLDVPTQNNASATETASDKKLDKPKGRMRGKSFGKSNAPIIPAAEANTQRPDMPSPASQLSSRKYPNKSKSRTTSQSEERPVKQISTASDAKTSLIKNISPMQESADSDNWGTEMSTYDFLSLYQGEEADDGEESCDSTGQEAAENNILQSKGRACSTGSLRGIVLVKSMIAAKDLTKAVQSKSHWKKRIGRLEGNELVLQKESVVSPTNPNSRKTSLDYEKKLLKLGSRSQNPFMGKAPSIEEFQGKQLEAAGSSWSIASLSRSKSGSNLKDMKDTSQNVSQTTQIKVKQKIMTSWDNLKSASGPSTKTQSMPPSAKVNHNNL
jgi:hypothetical protein